MTTRIGNILEKRAGSVNESKIDHQKLANDADSNYKHYANKGDEKHRLMERFRYHYHSSKIEGKSDSDKANHIKKAKAVYIDLGKPASLSKMHNDL